MFNRLSELHFKMMSTVENGKMKKNHKIHLFSEIETQAKSVISQMKINSKLFILFFTKAINRN